MVLFLIFVYVALSIIPVPFVDASEIKAASLPSFLSYVSIYSGGAISHFTIMATGVTSYIFSTMLIQILIFLNSKLYQFSKTPYGNKKVKTYITCLSLGLSFIFSIFITKTMNSTFKILLNSSWGTYIIIAAFHCMGTFIVIKIANEITREGHYEGITVLLVVNILQQLPSSAELIQQKTLTGEITLRHLTFFLIAAGILILFFLWVCTGEYKIPIQSTMEDKKLSFPIRLDSAGTTSIIFAESLIQLLYYFAQKSGNALIQELSKPFSIYGVLITSLFLFCFVFFYSFVFFNVSEISENMKISEQRFIYQPTNICTSNYLRLCLRHVNLFAALMFSLSYAIFEIICIRCAIPYISYIVVFLMVSSSISIGSQFRCRTKFFMKSI